MRNMQAGFDPLATKDPRNYRGTRHSPLVPGVTHKGGFGVPKNSPRRRSTGGRGFFDLPVPRRPRPSVPLRRSVLPLTRPSPQSLPTIRVPNPFRGNPILTAASILGEIYTYQPLIGREGFTPGLTFSWESADAVTFCPWAGDGVSPALGRIPITSISAQFNCGIFDLALSPRTGPDYELWHDCTVASPPPYNDFPGEVGSIIIVFNDLALPPGVPLVGPVSVNDFITDTGAVPTVLPFPGGLGGWNDGGAPAGFGPPFEPPPGPFFEPSGVGPERHYPRLPWKNEREGKKVIPRKTFEQFGRSAANWISEGNDFISAVFDALPRSAQFNQGVAPGSPTFNKITGKMGAIWNYARDGGLKDPGFLGRVVRNVIENEVKDRVFGQIGKRIAKATRSNPYWRSPVGPQAGGRYRPYASVGGN